MHKDSGGILMNFFSTKCRRPQLQSREITGMLNSSSSLVTIRRLRFIPPAQGVIVKERNVSKSERRMEPQH